MACCQCLAEMYHDESRQRPLWIVTGVTRYFWQSAQGLVQRRLTLSSVIPNRVAWYSAALIRNSFLTCASVSTHEVPEKNPNCRIRIQVNQISQRAEQGNNDIGAFSTALNVQKFFSSIFWWEDERVLICFLLCQRCCLQWDKQPLLFVFPPFPSKAPFLLSDS